MKNRDAILHVQAVLINVAKTKISTGTYAEFKAAGLKIIEELESVDKHKSKLHLVNVRKLEEALITGSATVIAFAFMTYFFIKILS